MRIALLFITIHEPRYTQSMIVDTHCHIYFEDFAKDLDEVLARAGKAGVERIINVGIDLETTRLALELARRSDRLFASAGIHPNCAQTAEAQAMSELKAMALAESKIVALGETGLDYYRKHCDPEIQRQVFRQFIRMALEVDLPLIIHCRQAEKDVIDIIGSSENRNSLRAVWHCFSGNLEHLARWLEMGHHASFTSNVTYPNAGNLREAIKEIPIERLMVETDAPYLAPQGHRGKRNEPAYLPELIGKIAELKRVTPDQVMAQTTLNAFNFFNIS